LDRLLLAPEGVKDYEDHLPLYCQQQQTVGRDLDFETVTELDFTHLLRIALQNGATRLPEFLAVGRSSGQAKALLPK
jgi:hypothetical protein